MFIHSQGRVLKEVQRGEVDFIAPCHITFMPLTALVAEVMVFGMSLKNGNFSLSIFLILKPFSGSWGENEWHNDFSANFEILKFGQDE